MTDAGVQHGSNGVWGELLTEGQSTAAAVVIAGAFAAGGIAGATWGGWRGAFAGLIGASAVRDGLGCLVYALHENSDHNKVAWLLGGLAVMESAGAIWLAKSVVVKNSVGMVPRS